MRIFHIATLADWKQAEESGTYTTSTYGVSLAEEGFLHAARHEQVRGVLDRYYGDVTEPLVVLEIETDLLDVPWREDPVGDEAFPHIYGPLTTAGRGAVAPRAPASVRGGRHRRPGAGANVVLAFYGLTVVLGVDCAGAGGRGPLRRRRGARVAADAPARDRVPGLDPRRRVRPSPPSRPSGSPGR